MTPGEGGLFIFPPVKKIKFYVDKRFLGCYVQAVLTKMGEKGMDMGGKGSGRPGVKRGPYKGGTSTIKGRVVIFIGESHRFSCMASKTGYVLRSRLVMAEKIGRPILPGEVVHHIDGNISNDTPENLVVETRAQHSANHRKLRPSTKGPQGRFSGLGPLSQTY